MTTTTVAPTRSRIAATLFWRGVSITACAAVAVRWPADGLLLAMAAVGALAIGFGAYDLFVAVRLRPSDRWWVLLLHGSLSIAFGVLSFVSLGLSRETAALLLLYAGACVATLFGMTEVGLAQWLRRATATRSLRTGG